MTTPEFSRPVRVETLGAEPRCVAIEAEAEERAALARRFDLAALTKLAADAALTRRNEQVVARGRLQAAVTQSCVATGVPVESEIDAPFELVFRPAPSESRPDEEVELSESELDVVFYDGGAIDLGQAMADTLALSLDAYPRAPGAEQALKAAGVKSEEEAGPFGALAALRDKLKK